MKNNEKNFVSAVIYVHNAEERLELFLKTILQTMEKNFEHSEIICVNDGSEDHSVDKIKEISKIARTTSISLIHMSGFHGVELAMDAGVDMSIGDFVFEFDNTVLDFAEAEIMEIYRQALEGYDIVSASSKVPEKLRSRLFYSVFNHFAGRSYRMNTESFRILSRRAVNRIHSMNRTVPYRKALYADCGLKTQNIKYSALDIKAKEDRRERAYKQGLAVDALVLFTNLGYRFCIFMTVLMILISAFTVVYSLVSYFVSNPVEGWTTTILFLSVSFFGLFCILTIIVKYLQLLLNIVFKRVTYRYESIEKLTK